MIRRLKKIAQTHWQARIYAGVAIATATVIWFLTPYASDEHKERLMLWAVVLTALLTLVLMYVVLSRGAEVIKSLEKRKEETDSVESSDGQGEVP